MVRESVRRVWVLASSNGAMLDVCGPFEVLRRATLLLDAGYDIVPVTARQRTISLSSGLGFVSRGTLREAAANGLPHTVIVAGGDPRVAQGSDEAEFARWLREHAKYVPRICSVCTGAFVLGEAGLLDGRRATTHWSLLDDLKRRFPRARVADDVLFMRDGPIWTCAGMTAGIDMTLALVEEDLGYQASLAIARFMVLFLRRSGSQRQFSAALAAQQSERQCLRDLQAHIASHLDDDLSIERLAEVCSMSPRNLCRVFRKEIGQSLGQFVRAMRLDEARRLLQDTDLGVSRIASRVGCGDESTLRRWFVEEFGISPAQYRERFGQGVRTAPAGQPQPTRARRRAPARRT